MTSAEAFMDEEAVWSDDAAERYLSAGRIRRDAEFVDFVETHGGRLERIAFLISGDHHRAEELFQATLERTYRAWGRARDGDPFVYARRILANLKVDTWRRTRREVLHAHGDGPPGSVADRTTEVTVRDELVRALLLLPVKQRRVVVLRHLLDLSEAEVADELGMPRGTVKSNASRGLARLRAELTSPTGTVGAAGTSTADTTDTRKVDSDD
ncbi:SigE family RNA polymerase sigma factor [Oerskovia sp. KBS0722]|uniref:SigE family RNA polymerase sigma factor n=1 Tax=Oerskovia sp. KBS0722 TaxID=1179673 RepID=UPI001FEE01ED|nr:SigE family RNA polymerase sigma factor [Oerskovia sp. KBS0722]